MPLKLIVSDAASLAVTEQARYYRDRQGAGLSDDWTRAVMAGIQSLRFSPERGSLCRFEHPKLRGLRWIRVEKFPYRVFYQSDPGLGIVRIVHILHVSRETEYLLLRD
jgi:plasmid stabilization system protein ParE